MDTVFWDNRYREHKTAYGWEPNVFFKAFIDAHKPGSILLPAEGEGRNAIYAASKGWQVDAFDLSGVAREKALSRAAAKGVVINYSLQRIEEFRARKLYDVVGLIFIHLPAVVRRKFHHEVHKSLKPGGYVVFQAFAEEQLQRNTGGPKDPALLYEASSICDDFQFLHMITCCQREIELHEGPYHQGKGEVLQLIGQKL